MKFSAQFKQKGLARRSLLAKAGFTLIELLIVIVIIATLAVTVFVALDPAKRLKDTRDARRTSDIQSILTAIHQSIVDKGGTSPSNLPAAGTERMLGAGLGGVGQPCEAAVTAGGCAHPASTACANLMIGAQNLAKYLKTMSIDPSGGTNTSDNTGYSVAVDANNIVTVKACRKENPDAAINIWASR